MLNIINDCRSKNLQVSDVTFDENAKFYIESYNEADSDDDDKQTDSKIE